MSALLVPEKTTPTMMLEERVSRARALWLYRYLEQNPSKLQVEEDVLASQTEAETFHTAEEYAILTKRFLTMAANSSDNQEGIHTVTYTPSSHGFGRLFSGRRAAVQVQGLSRHLRHTLMAEECDDIDAVNCFPEIIIQIGERIGLDLPCMKEYCKNRKIYFDLGVQGGASKDHIKRAFMRVIFGGGLTSGLGSTTVESILANLRKEIKMANERLFEHPTLAVLREIVEKNKKPSKGRPSKKDTKKEDKKPWTNYEGSTVSLYCQCIENACLQEWISVFKEAGVQPVALCFDGFMVPKGTATEALLRKAEERALEKTGFSLKLEVKEMNEGFSIPQNELELCEQEVLESIRKGVPLIQELESIPQSIIDKMSPQELYKVQKDEYNKIACFIESQQRIAILSETVRKKPNTKDEMYKIQSTMYVELGKKHQKFAETNQKARIYGKPMQAILWEEDTEKRTANDVVTNPSLPFGYNVLPGNVRVWNEFAGFQYDGRDREYDETTDGELIKPYLELLRNVTSGDQETNEEECYEYLVNHMASIFQFPQRKTEVCVILTGSQGDGKDTAIDAFGKLFGIANGAYIISTNPKGDFMSKFNTLIRNAIVVKAEELSFADSKDAQGKFKSLITAPTLSFEGKGEPIITLDSYHNFFGTTNEAVPAVFEPGERRFVLLRTSGANNGNVQYWTDLYNLINSEEFCHALARFFRCKKIPEGFCSRACRPKTSAQQYAQQVCRPWHAAWLEDLIGGKFDRIIDEKKEVRKYKEGDSQMLEVWACDLLNLINDTVGSDSQKSSRFTATKVGRALSNKEGYPEAAIEKKHKRTGAVYQFNFNAIRSHLQSKEGNYSWSGFYD